MYGPAQHAAIWANSPTCNRSLSAGRAVFCHLHQGNQYGGPCLRSHDSQSNFAQDSIGEFRIMRRRPSGEFRGTYPESQEESTSATRNVKACQGYQTNKQEEPQIVEAMRRSQLKSQTCMGGLAADIHSAAKLP